MGGSGTRWNALPVLLPSEIPFDFLDVFIFLVCETALLWRCLCIILSLSSTIFPYIYSPFVLARLLSSLFYLFISYFPLWCHREVLTSRHQDHCYLLGSHRLKKINSSAPYLGWGVGICDE
jgi:hypothetical protein